MLFSIIHGSYIIFFKKKTAVTVLSGNKSFYISKVGLNTIDSLAYMFWSQGILSLCLFLNHV